MFDLEMVTEMIRHFPWSREAVERGYQTVFSKMETDPAERARILVEDMEKIGCKWPISAIPVDENIVLSHYEIPGTQFGQESDADAADIFKAHGTGLNWGSVVRLSKACEIGRRYFPSEWPERFKGKIMNAVDHF